MKKSRLDRAQQVRVEIARQVSKVQSKAEEEARAQVLENHMKQLKANLQKMADAELRMLSAIRGHNNALVSLYARQAREDRERKRKEARWRITPKKRSSPHVRH